MQKSTAGICVSVFFGLAVAFIPLPAVIQLPAQILVVVALIFFGAFWLYIHFRERSAMQPADSIKEIYDSFSDLVKKTYPNRMAAFWNVKAYDLDSVNFYRLADEIRENQPENDPFKAYEPWFPRETWFSAFKEARRRNMDLSDPREAMQFYRENTPYLAGSRDHQVLDKCLNIFKLNPEMYSLEAINTAGAHELTQDGIEWLNKEIQSNGYSPPFSLLPTIPVERRKEFLEYMAEKDAHVLNEQTLFDVMLNFMLDHPTPPSVENHS